MDTQAWLSATYNVVNLWGDTELERVSLYSNLDRLKNLLETLPEDELIHQVHKLGDKIIPDTESGIENIRMLINSTQHDWDEFVSTIKSTMNALETKLQQWDEFETAKERCLSWIRDTDIAIHAVDLKNTLPEKKEQLEKLRSLQGEIRAKELEIDAVTERAQQLYKSSSSRTSQISELGFKYQQITSKVKEMNNLWQRYVTSHQEFDNQMSECSRWLENVKNKLAYCSDLSTASQNQLEKKMEIIQDIILGKEDGFAKVRLFVTTFFSFILNPQTNCFLHLRFKISWK